MITRNEFLHELSLLKTAWLSMKIIFQYFGFMLGIFVIVLMPLDIIQFAIDNQIDEALKQFGMPQVLAVFPSSIFDMFAGLIGSAVIALVVGQLIEGDSPTLRGTFSRISGPRILKVFGTLVFATFLSSLPFAIYMAIFIALAYWSVLTAKWLLYVYLATIAIPIIIMIALTISYSFSVYVAVFENTFYWHALARSNALARGRRVWLGTVFGVVFIPILILASILNFLPDFFGGLHRSYQSLVGIGHLFLLSIVTSCLTTFFYLFQTFIYFRRRREVHDLTFYDMSRSDLIRPASKLLEE